ncbi:MAG: anhydro-N-acetylmuramic acid kinase [Dehalococcoidales bacterium]
MAKYKVIGLMSGTSAYGIDAAVVEIWGKEPDIKIKLLDFESYPYSHEVRREIAQACSARTGRLDKICQLNFLLGELFASAALMLANKAGLEPGEVALIGSHGQTIHHLPTPGLLAGIETSSSLQLGEPSIIAQRTGITTIADFRPRDMAAGGCGAPLAPYFHYLAFRHRRRNRLVINLGGIANITYIPARASLDDLTAFDTGPGNCLIDELVREFTSGQEWYDDGGLMAMAGEVNERLLDRLMRDPFVRHNPPKSTGPEHFNLRRLRLWPPKGRNFEDLLATATAFTAHALAYNIRTFVLSKGPLDEVIIGGGGVHNKMLLTELKLSLAPVPTHTFEEFGFSSRAAEAQAFALLAYLTFMGKGGNLPGVTGARERVVLGKIVPGQRASRALLELVKSRRQPG